MPLGANVEPIYTVTPRTQGIAITAVNTRSDGNGTIATDIFKAFTAHATYGSYVARIRFSPVATVAATATAATVLRVFISSQTSGATTQANTWLIQEVAAPTQTAAQTTTATNYIEIPLGFALEPNYTILVTTHVANAANTSWTAVVVAGDYA
jgi:hypothetical protein